jgi:pimeloyl-ACP methyl ester carboxylesterase
MIAGRSALAAALGALLLVLVSCAGAGVRQTEEPVASASRPEPGTSGSPAANVTVTKDLAYESSSINALGVLDVYAPTADGVWPVVVMFHGQPLTKSWLTSYATRVAELGFVVFVPTWGQSGGPDYDAMTVKQQLTADGVQAACAIAFAVERAAEYGGDASSLTVFGHSAGAMIASVAVLGPPELADGCLAQASPQVDVLVTWDGDWLVVTKAFGWDDYLAAEPTLMESITPWAHLPPPPGLRFIMLQPETSGEGRSATDARGETGWLAARDPDGTLTSALEAINAFEDDFIAPDETDRVLGAVLRTYGADVTYEEMPGSSHLGLSSEGWEMFIDVFREVGGY